MTKKPKRMPVKVQNPRYEGATPEMVGRALLRRESEDQAEDGEASRTVADPVVQASI